MNFIDNDNNSDNKVLNSNNTLFYIGLIALGAAVTYFLLKDKLSQQTVQSSSLSSQYDNDEQWHIQRGDEGFIDDVKVGRHANVGSGDDYNNYNNVHHNYESNYVSLNSINNNENNNSNNIIDKAQLDKYVNERIKNGLFRKIKIDSINELIGVSKTVYSDDERRRRFGMN